MAEKITEFTNFEKTRILGARALQIAMDAPLLKEISKEELLALKYDPLEIAEEEFNAEVLPITIKQPMPQKKMLKLTKPVEKAKVEDTEIVKKEVEEEKDIEEEGEIMELATPEDEGIEEEAEGREASEELQ